MTYDKRGKVDEVDSKATLDDLSDAIVVENSGHVGELSGLVTQDKKRENQIADDKPSSLKNQRMSGNKVDESKEKDEVLYRAQDFRIGNIVWAKCTEGNPAWPAIVIDPKQAPEAVREARVSNTVCVMFYGYTKKEEREFGWIANGMIYPFLEYLESFLGQTQLYDSTPDDFRRAIHEAYRAGNGYLNMRFEDREERSAAPQAVNIPVVNVSDIPESSHRGQKLKQHCGICKQILDYSDVEYYIFCDGCNSSVHPQCAKVSTKDLKGMNRAQYYCPACKGKSPADDQPTVKKHKPKHRRHAEMNDQSALPDEKIEVVCNGKEGIYYPKDHMVECKCGSCGTQKQRPGDWEIHCGSKAKKWKYSIKVKASMTPLGNMVSGKNVNGGKV